MFIIKKLNVVDNILYISILLFVSFLINLNTVSAQNKNYDQLYCPINGSVDVINEVFDQMVADDFHSSVKLINNTDFVLADISVAVVFYDKNNIPVYWAKSPAKFLTLPKKELNINLNFKLDYLPAGEYIIKYITTQGDDLNSLGEILLKGEDIVGSKLIKNSEVKNNLNLQIEVNGGLSDVIKISDYEDIKVDVSIKNDNKDDVLEGEMIGVISQSEHPLGSAVYNSKIDDFRIIPNRKKNSKFESIKNVPGIYNVYVGLLSPIYVYPIKSVSVKVGNEEVNKSWLYLSQIGFSEYPVTENTDLIACIKYIGEKKHEASIQELIALNLEINKGEEILFKEKKYTNTSNYILFSPKLISDEFSYKIDLLQQRNPFIGSETEEGILIDDSRDALIAVGTYTGNFMCEIDSYCSIKNNNDFSYKYYLNKKSPWFYIGIIIASLLLFGLLKSNLLRKEKINKIEK